MAKVDRKKRKTTQLKDLMPYIAEELETLDNQELLTFRIPVLLEYMMVWYLAQRLGVAEDDLPNLDYSDLATLALSGKKHDAIRAQVLKLGEVRNHLGHYLDKAMWRQNIGEFLRLQGLPVPSDSATLMTLYDHSMSSVYISLMLDIAADSVDPEVIEARRQFDAKRAAQTELLKRLVVNAE